MCERPTLNCKGKENLLLPIKVFDKNAVQSSPEKLTEGIVGVITQEHLADLITTVDNHIPKSSLTEMKFLCYTLVGDINILKKAKDARDIFREMLDYGSLSKDNPVLISELLTRLRKVGLEKKLFESDSPTKWRPGMTTSFDNFRCLLFDITQNLKKRHLELMKSFCIDQEELNQSDAEALTDSLDFFQLLEDDALIAYNNIGFLKDLAGILKLKAIKDLIENYEDELKKTEPVLSLESKGVGSLLRSSQILSAEDIISMLEKFPEVLPYKKFIASLRRDKQELNRNKNGQKSSLVSLQGLLTPDMLAGKLTDLKVTDSAAEVFCGEGEDPIKPQPLTVHLPKETSYHDTGNAHLPLKSKDSSSSGEEDNNVSSISLACYQEKTLNLPIYEMEKPKGICLIISNRVFKGEPGTKQPNDRNGTEKDTENLQYTFEKLHFEVHKKEDLSVKEMETELRKWRDYDHTKHHAFVCCILSHGNTGIVLGTDCKSLELVKIIGYFKGNCASLVDKPKIFIIQACQGSQWQSLSTPKSPTGEKAGMGFGLDILPKESDIALLLSTVPGYFSARSRKQGSWFIMALTTILNNHGDAELHSIMTLVNQELSRATAKIDNQIVCQLAYPVYTLKKLLFFCNPLKE